MKVTSGNIRAWERLGQKGTVFNYGLIDLAAEKDDIRVLCADLSYLSGMDKFIRKYPDKFLQVGIAEQNMMGIAAGLAMEGELVIASTYCSFIAVRSLEQIRQNLSNTKANVKIIGTFAGVVSAKSGVSHWATEDLAIMRALPNKTVLSPADSTEAYKAFNAACELDGPVYIRLSGSANCPIVYESDYDFKIGKIVKLMEGNSAAILSTGLMVKESLLAAELLKEKGIDCAVYNVHTIKPLDRESLREIFSKYSLIVTVEEHNIVGGMGSAVAEFKSTLDNTPRQVFLGFNDCFTEAGSQKYIWSLAGISHEEIAKRISKELEI